MSAKATFSWTVLVGRSLKSWKTMPTLRRRCGTLERDSLATSCPSTMTRPVDGSSSLMRSRFSVDLPAPEEPTAKTNSPAPMCRSMSRSAYVPLG